MIASDRAVKKVCIHSSGGSVSGSEDYCRRQHGYADTHLGLGDTFLISLPPLSGLSQQHRSPRYFAFTRLHGLSQRERTVAFTTADRTFHGQTCSKFVLLSVLLAVRHGGKSDWSFVRCTCDEHPERNGFLRKFEKDIAHVMSSLPDPVLDGQNGN